MGQAFSHRRQSRRNDVLEEAVHTAGAHTVPTSRHSSSASPTSPPCMDRNTCDCNRSSSALTTSRRLSLLVTAFIQDLHLTSRRPLTAAVQALAANPGHAKAWVKLSNFGGGEVREYFVGKKECLERALNAEPMYARAWVNLGMSLHCNGATSVCHCTVMIYFRQQQRACNLLVAVCVLS